MTATPGADVSSVAELQAVLALDAATKSGATYTIAPGDYTSMAASDWHDATVGLTEPMVLRAFNPADKPVFRQISLRGTETGNLTLRDLAFDLTHIAKADFGVSASATTAVSAIEAEGSETTEGLSIIDCDVTGPCGNGRLDPREPVHEPRFFDGELCNNLAIRGCNFTGIFYGVTVSGTNILIEDNIHDDAWADMLRLRPPPNGAALPHTDGVTVRRNVLNTAGPGRLHPDMMQAVRPTGRTGEIRNILVERNIATAGENFVRMPAYKTGPTQVWHDVNPGALPATSNTTHVVPGGTVTLPTAPDAGTVIAVQARGETGTGNSLGDVTVQAGAGDALDVYGSTAAVLDDAWLTLVFTYEATTPNTWAASVETQSVQFVMDNADMDSLTIRHNIVAATSINVCNLPGTTNATITENSFIRVFPGDMNGDGVSNGWQDRLDPSDNLGSIRVTAGDVTYNVMSPSSYSGATGQVVLSNDPADVSGAFPAQVEASDSGVIWNPSTAAEALAAARPKSDGTLAATTAGAVRANPVNDPVDWSWVT